MESVASMYADPPNRAGFILCPFHSEKTASCKIYERSWHCFGCGAGGDAVTFVSRLYQLEPLQAAKKLDADFGLALFSDTLTAPDRKRIRREKERRKKSNATWQAFDVWKDETALLLTEVIRVANQAEQQGPPWTPAQIDELKWREAAEDKLTTLESGDADEMITVFRERNEVKNKCEKIMRSTKTKSATDYTLTLFLIRSGFTAFQI